MRIYELSDLKSVQSQRIADQELEAYGEPAPGFSAHLLEGVDDGHDARRDEQVEQHEREGRRLVVRAAPLLEHVQDVRRRRAAAAGHNMPLPADEDEEADDEEEIEGEDDSEEEYEEEAEEESKDEYDEESEEEL